MIVKYVGMKKTPLAVKNGANVMSHLQLVRYFCTINKNGEF